MGDAAGARRQIEAALKDNPFFLPGWAYLLRLLKLAPAADQSEVLGRMQAAVPWSAQLAGLAAGLMPAREACAWLGEKLCSYQREYNQDQRRAISAQLVPAIVKLCGPRL